VTEESLTALQTEYATLQSQYDKLIRTTKEKYVVSVRYTKQDGNNLYEIKSTSENNYTQSNKENLHTQMQDLKDKYQDNLYI